MAEDSPPIEPLEPAEAWALKEEGNQLYHAGFTGEADDKYMTAVHSIVRSSNELPVTLIESIALAGFQAGSPDTVLFYASVLPAFAVQMSNIPAYCTLLKLAGENGGLETGLWLVGVLCRDIMPRDDLQEDDREMILQVVEEYKQKLPFHVEQCVSAPFMAPLNLGMHVVMAKRALQRCSSALNSFQGGCGDAASTDASSAPATLARVTQLKEEGDQEADRKNYAAAVAKWREALSGFVLLPILLSNLAQVSVKGKAEHTVLLYALAVLAMQPSHAKSYAQVATVALGANADWLQAAADCAAEGLRHSPAHPRLLSIQKKALKALTRGGAAAAASSTLQVQAAPAPPSKKRGGMHAQASPSPARGSLPTEWTTVRGASGVHTAWQQAMEANPKALDAVERLVGPKPDDFCKSFIDARVLPAGCSEEAVMAILSKAASVAFGGWEWHAAFCASAAIGLPWKDVDTASRDPMQFLGQGILVERLSSVSPERLAWFKDAPIGTLNCDERSGYPEAVIASFDNVAQHALPIPAAGTHVAVGFVDLGELAGTVALHQSKSAQTGPESAPDTDTDGGIEVLRWVGIDQSAFCCAKTLVILKMMERGVDSREIVQVWYSAGWSAATLHDFHACVAALLEEPSDAVTALAEVRQWLQAWHGTRVPLATARAIWTERTLKWQQAWISNLLRKDDRMAACAFAVSGDVFFPESPETVGNVKARARGAKKSGKDSKLEVSTGSVVMFPDSIRDAPDLYAFMESFLYVVPPEELIVERLQGNNLLLAAAVCARRRVDALARALRGKHVTCEVWHTRLAADTVLGADTPQISRVRALQPTSMSWSSLCDCMEPSALMQLLRSCAKPGCPHFMHALNWKMDIKGAFLVDYGYPASTSKKGVEQAKERVQIWEDAQKLVRDDVKSMRAERLMRVQPMENPSNVCEVLLAQRMLPKWLEGLAAADECSGKGSEVTFEVLHAPQYWIFSRAYSGAQFVLRCGGGSK